jgi:hypothetical protein
MPCRALIGVICVINIISPRLGLLHRVALPANKLLYGLKITEGLPESIPGNQHADGSVTDKAAAHPNSFSCEQQYLSLCIAHAVVYFHVPVGLES